MKHAFQDDFDNLMNSISSVISHKILSLYYTSERGYNLTETSQKIKEKISTTQDYINKLLNYKLIYRMGNDYFLSNLGEYIYEELKKLSSLEQFKSILGNIPKNRIPHEIVDEFIPFIKDFQFHTSSWKFMNMMDKHIDKMKANIGKNPQVFEIIGWWSLEYDLEIMKTKFPQFNLHDASWKNFLKNFQFKFVAHKPIIKELRNYDLLEKILGDRLYADQFRIYDKVDRLNFTFFRFNHLLGAFLVKNDDIDYQNYMFIENNEGALEVFEKLFEHYWKNSKPLYEFI